MNRDVRREGQTMCTGIARNLNDYIKAKELKDIFIKRKQLDQSIAIRLDKIIGEARRNLYYLISVDIDSAFPVHFQNRNLEENK